MKSRTSHKACRYTTFICLPMDEIASCLPMDEIASLQHDKTATLHPSLSNEWSFARASAVLAAKVVQVWLQYVQRIQIWGFERSGDIL